MAELPLRPTGANALLHSRYQAKVYVAIRESAEKGAFMFSRIGVALLTVAILTPTVSIAANRTSNGSDCSYLVVNRTYANQFSGFLNVPAYFAAHGIPAPPGVGVVPNAGAGTMTFLPDGKMTSTETLAIGLLGLQQDLVIKGTYSVTWDTSRDPVVCSGAVQGFSADGTAYNFDIAVSRDGLRIDAIHTDQGIMVGFSMSPMKGGRCRNDSVEGTYSINTQGWVLGLALGGAPPEQELGGYVAGTSMGAIRFRPYASPSGFADAPAGAGSIEKWDTLSLNGMIIPRKTIGWYKINPNCTGTLTMRDNTGVPDSHLELVVGKEGEAVYSVIVDTATVNGMTITPHILGMTFNRMDESHR
jgi:hypothetical protein